MVNLIIHQLKQTNPELIPPGTEAIDAVRHALVPAEQKKDVLDIVWRNAGLETLLSIGQGVRDIGYDPLWHAALRSVSPAVFFEKWQRFEVFGHSQNRLHIAWAGENCASFQRYTVDGGTPAAPENLLICSLMIALLEGIGCRGLRCGIPLETGADFCIREDGRFFVPEDTDALKTDTWTIEWRVFSPPTENTIPESEPPDVPLPRSCNSMLRASIETVVRLLCLDVTRQWKVGELAREAGLSTRSLQRRLRDAELSFTRLVRLARIHEACHLLKDGDIPLTTVGFCAGFSDSAHFSRDFRASMGMTPSDYRAVFLGA